jgi:hypothetical protein
MLRTAAKATPPSDAKLMADQIPNAHLANLEQPDTFNQIVAAFASELGKAKQS